MGLAERLSCGPHQEAVLVAIFANGAHVASMAKPAGEITLSPQPVKFGAQWHVVGTYPGGQQEHITGFKTQADALDWIATESANWLKNRRIR
jgi:hypothetical protein